jgi:hypothetical protein
MKDIAEVRARLEAACLPDGMTTRRPVNRMVSNTDLRALLAHDAALAARVEALEAALRQIAFMTANDMGGPPSSSRTSAWVNVIASAALKGKTDANHR